MAAARLDFHDARLGSPGMDQPTLDVYARSAGEFAERYEAVASPVARYFALAFPAGSRVLDVGAGSGRDLAHLLASGFQGFGVEPCEELRAQALARHPQLQGRLDTAALPALGEPFGGGFDGVLCSAVLMHVGEAELFDAAWALKSLLRPHGRLLLSLPLARTDVGAGERDAQGRLFKAYAPAHVQLLFERLGFQQIGRWDSEDALGRCGTRWATLLLELCSGTTLRAVDQIEGILNRDKKVATYKLALFRALADRDLTGSWCSACRSSREVGGTSPAGTVCSIPWSSTVSSACARRSRGGCCTSFWDGGPSRWSRYQLHWSARWRTHPTEHWWRRGWVCVYPCHRCRQSAGNLDALLRNGRGASHDTRRALAQALDLATLAGTCRVCGAVITGRQFEASFLGFIARCNCGHQWTLQRSCNGAIQAEYRLGDQRRPFSETGSLELFVESQSP
jgi:SAM-dependent methyltransferase